MKLLAIATTLLLGASALGQTANSFLHDIRANTTEDQNSVFDSCNFLETENFRLDIRTDEFAGFGSVALDVRPSKRYRWTVPVAQANFRGADKNLGNNLRFSVRKESYTERTHGEQDSPYLVRTYTLQVRVEENNYKALDFDNLSLDGPLRAQTPHLTTFTYDQIQQINTNVSKELKVGRVLNVKCVLLLSKKADYYKAIYK
jgi:hypothetical protein